MKPVCQPLWPGAVAVLWGRCIGSVPGGHWKTMTLIAGLHADRLTAPWCADQAMSGKSFKEYLRWQLEPTFKPGDIAICDNLLTASGGGSSGEWKRFRRLGGESNGKRAWRTRACTIGANSLVPLAGIRTACISRVVPGRLP
jgi:hypothetical protein